MRSDTYKKYINSTDWKLFRLQVLSERGHRCEGCGATASSGALQVHHKHYDSLGEEKAEDVAVLCIPCHKKADAARAAEREARAWEARVDGWANKRWGEDWNYYRSWDEAVEEFDRWLESRGEM